MRWRRTVSSKWLFSFLERFGGLSDQSTGGWRRSGKSLAEVSSQSTAIVRSRCEYNVHFIGTCDNASTPGGGAARQAQGSTGDSLGQPKYAETAHPWSMDKQ